MIDAQVKQQPGSTLPPQSGSLTWAEKPSNLGGAGGFLDRMRPENKPHRIMCRWPSCFPPPRAQSEPQRSPVCSPSASVGVSQILLLQLDPISHGASLGLLDMARGDHKAPEGGGRGHRCHLLFKSRKRQPAKQALASAKKVCKSGTETVLQRSC